MGVIDFVAGIEGPCTRCGGAGGRMRELVAVKSRRGNGFTVERVYCDPCADAARSHEHRLAAAYQALIDAGNSPASACGLLLAHVDETLRGGARAA